MGDIKNFNGQINLTMSSREIAELVESRHDKVKQSIERLVERGTIVQPPLGDGIRSTNGIVEKVYLLQKRDSYIVVAQLSPKFTARLVDRWQVLEERAANSIANLSRVDLLKMALESEEKCAALEHKVEVLAPKAEALDRLETYSEGSFCVRDAAKNLQIQEKKFTQYLMQIGWTYRRPLGHSLIAYAEILKQGLMEHKTTTGESGDGTEWIDTQARITAKGITKLSKLFGGLSLN